jgi:hypothetical protein
MSGQYFPPKNFLSYSTSIDEFLATVESDRKRSTFFPKTASLTEASSTIRQRRQGTAYSKNQQYEQMLCKILDLKRIRIDATGMPVASTAVEASDNIGPDGDDRLMKISEALLTGKKSFFATPVEK